MNDFDNDDTEQGSPVKGLLIFFAVIFVIFVITWNSVG
jgi:hypothetical protein